MAENRPGPRTNEGSGQGLRSLPSVETLVGAFEAQDATLPRALVVEALRLSLQAARAQIQSGGPDARAEDIVGDTRAALRQRLEPTLRPLINATGVILHTNLGRSPISDEAARAMAEISTSYSNLEFDLETGRRGSRASHLRDLLRELTGAEDGVAVNNNASAVLLALTTLASGREVVISRGQAVEIGGGFRIPDVMKQSGALLVEIGTTNRTYLADYQTATTERTALFLRVHPSNFRVDGFVHSVELPELVELAGRVGVGVMDDVGSGALIDPHQYGLAGEPMVQESVAAGATVVCFSGDKLLGGPQAGLIVGRREAIEAIRRHPLARAVRIDKGSLAGLEATLRHYQRGEAPSRIPIWRMVSEPDAELARRGHAIVDLLASSRVDVIPTRAAVGGGSLPGETLPSHSVRIRDASESSGGAWAGEAATRLRRWRRPIVGRVEDGGLLLDLRTVAPEDDPEIIAAISGILTA